MEEIEKLLQKILKELEFHGKLLSSLVEQVDAKTHQHQEAKQKVGVQLEELAAMLGNMPMAGALKNMAQHFGTGGTRKDGD